MKRRGEDEDGGNENDKKRKGTAATTSNEYKMCSDRECVKEITKVHKVK